MGYSTQSRPAFFSQLILVCCLLVLASSCATPLYDPSGEIAPPKPYTYAVRPVTAVTDFQNKSSFQGQWNLGDGMAEVLVTALLDTRAVTVLERKHLDDVIGEIFRQGKGLFREEGKVQPGRLKNARYLIRGAITDFTVVGDGSGWFGIEDKGKIGGGGSKARVALHITISDVETGEIISSVKTDGSASKGWFSAAVNYKRVSFGGDAFFRTPLGKATEKAIGKAVKKILKDIPEEYWKARVAESRSDMIVINGGENVGLQTGAMFLVRGRPRDITDPITGDVIERVPGQVLGKVRVVKVNPSSSYAIIMEGTTKRGDVLEAFVPEKPRK